MKHLVFGLEGKQSQCLATRKLSSAVQNQSSTFQGGAPGETHPLRDELSHKQESIAWASSGWPGKASLPREQFISIPLNQVPNFSNL